MDDANAILILIAESDETKKAFRDTFNRDRYDGPLKKDDEKASKSSSDTASRGTTPSCQGDGEDESEICRLLLTFNKPPKDIGRGFSFGTNQHKCDVLLKPEKKNQMSRLHFSITFDEKQQLVLRDTSTHGTWVSFGEDKDPNPRHHFQWVLFSDQGLIKVTIGKLCFRIEHPSHAGCEAQYQANVESYLEQSQRADPPLDFLNIDSNTTNAALTDLLPPKQRPKYRKISVIGRGDFGTVYKALDVSTGDSYALKEFYRGDWKREVEILRGISHVSITLHQRPIAYHVRRSILSGL